MKGKEAILFIIKNRGRCYEEDNYVSCQDCPLKKHGSQCPFIDEATDVHYTKTIYDKAVKVFLERYGAKEDLVEELL